MTDLVALLRALRTRRAQVSVEQRFVMELVGDAFSVGARGNTNWRRNAIRLDTAQIVQSLTDLGFHTTLINDNRVVIDWRDAAPDTLAGLIEQIRRADAKELVIVGDLLCIAMNGNSQETWSVGVSPMDFLRVERRLARCGLPLQASSDQRRVAVQVPR